MRVSVGFSRAPNRPMRAEIIFELNAKMKNKFQKITSEWFSDDEFLGMALIKAIFL